LRETVDTDLNLPLVSVIMPIRNEAAYIRQSLTAVLEQDYPPSRIEVIVCDGMSTDGTRDIVQELIAEFPRIQLVDNQRCIAPTAMNTAHEHCRGEIIARVDGHCVIAHDYIRRCVEHLQSGNVDGVGGPIETIGQTPTAKIVAAAMSSRFGVGGSAFRIGDVHTKLVDTIAFPVYSRQIMAQVGPYDEQLVRNQDDEYNYRIRKAGGKLMLAPDVRSLYYSRGTLRKLARQYFQYGYWKVRVLQKHPKQMRQRQFAPPLFVAASLILVVLSLVTDWGGVLLAIWLGGYLSLLAMGTWSTYQTELGLRGLMLLPVAFTILHISYGLGFIVGLFRFFHYWFSCHRAATANV
jgi:glycosyltransferase involved in cell wall biosynthesis